ncbi:MAG: hypothetical protein ACK55I_09040, partial [bacterium]
PPLQPRHGRGACRFPSALPLPHGPSGRRSGCRPRRAFRPRPGPRRGHPSGDPLRGAHRFPVERPAWLPAWPRAGFRPHRPGPGSVAGYTAGRCPCAS